MSDHDDGGFARNEGRHDYALHPYFECYVREEACADLDEKTLAGCPCQDCTSYLAYVAEMDEADAEWSDSP